MQHECELLLNCCQRRLSTCLCLDVIYSIPQLIKCYDGNYPHGKCCDYRFGLKCTNTKLCSYCRALRMCACDHQVHRLIFCHPTRLHLSNDRRMKKERALTRRTITGYQWKLSVLSNAPFPFHALTRFFSLTFVRHVDLFVSNEMKPRDSCSENIVQSKFHLLAKSFPYTHFNRTKMRIRASILTLIEAPNRFLTKAF